MNGAQKRLVKSINLARKLSSRGTREGVALAKFIKIKNRIIYSCDIGIGAYIPDDCVFHHSGLGVVIGNNVKMGNSCQLYSNICIGVKGNGIDDGDPQIGNNVVIGTGAILLGNIHVGDQSVIAAGAVVINDVPAGVMVAGNPAVIKNKKV